jgi:hypothetical protein
MAAAFPSRAYIQQFRGVLPPDYRPVSEELQSRGIAVIGLDDISQASQITRNDLVVGDFSWTRYALNKLGVAMPSPPDYPACLRHLLHRRVWQSTLGEVRTLLDGPADERPSQVFLKPAVRDLLTGIWFAR